MSQLAVNLRVALLTILALCCVVIPDGTVSAQTTIKSSPYRITGTVVSSTDGSPFATATLLPASQTPLLLVLELWAREPPVEEAALLTDSPLWLRTTRWTRMTTVISPSHFPPLAPGPSRPTPVDTPVEPMSSISNTLLRSSSPPKLPHTISSSVYPPRPASPASCSMRLASRFATPRLRFTSSPHRCPTARNHR